MNTQQAEAQLNYLQNLAARSIESTGKLIALNLSTARASMAQSSAAVRHILTVKDPRDLLALATPTQESFESMLAYGRALAEIASGTPVSQPAPQAAMPPSLEPKQLDMLTPKPKASKKKLG